MHTCKPSILRMKYLFFIFISTSIFYILHLHQKHRNAAKNTRRANPRADPIKFIEGIEIKASPVSIIQEEIIEPGKNDYHQKLQVKEHQTDVSIENISSIQFKYAQLLNRNVGRCKEYSHVSVLLMNGWIRGIVMVAAVKTELIAVVYRVN